MNRMPHRPFIRYRFDERKAVQAAGLLLARSEGYLNYMKLIKLLYLADREHLDLYGAPIVGGAYAALPYGPVITEVKERITETRSDYWNEHISPPADYEVKLLKDVGDDDLNDAEVEILELIAKRYKDVHPFDLVNELHGGLPEWRDPAGSSFTIWVEDILRALGKNDIEIAAAARLAADTECTDRALLDVQEE